ncbi:MAG: hypothetical protein H7647_06560 [Candidatus Heimdallarchaeota archaeon]|nr:hypothetical protein [Candidatus Heimdallarchaeota archaeon]MCK4254088.1 hypothetical protein [Candidatus Heimdallarchaeota archaeon]
MKIDFKKFINIRLFIVLTCILVFILVNSTQETYYGIDDYPISTLSTTSFSPPAPTTDPLTTDPSAPPYPTNTPTVPPNNPQGGSEGLVPAQVIPIAVAVIIVLIIAFLFLRRKTEESRSVPRSMVTGSTLQSRREKFRTQIRTLTEVLGEYLREGKYTEGIIFGYHQLDENMKKILGISRETYLTPKEFAKSLDLPNILPHLNSMIQTFYVARYKKQQMKKKDLLDFIRDLEAVKGLSAAQTDIEIIQRIREEDEQ